MSGGDGAGFDALAAPSTNAPTMAKTADIIAAQARTLCAAPICGSIVEAQVGKARSRNYALQGDVDAVKRTAADAQHHASDIGSICKILQTMRGTAKRRTSWVKRRNASTRLGKRLRAAVA